MKYPDEQVVRMLKRMYPEWGKECGILDWGCGNGRNGPMLLDFIGNPKYGVFLYGIDISETELAKAEETGAYCVLRKLPVEESFFPEGHFDLIIDDCTTCHVENPDKAFKEMHRILRPGGKAIIGFMVTGSKWQHGPKFPVPISEVIYQGIVVGGPEDGCHQNFIILDSNEYFRDLGFEILHKEIWSRKGDGYDFMFLWLGLQKK